MGKTEVHALRGLSLEITPGAFVAIMGSSGSGKSTLLNMIGCLDFPDKGKVYLKGKDISQMSESQLAQFRGKILGFVFQEFNLLSHLNAAENVMLPMVFQKIPLAERKEKAEKLLGMVGLKERISHQPSELSGGERQRVALARAFANNPEVIIADEPTGNLDSVTGKLIMEILTNFHKKEGKTMVVVTHDPRIANYAENIVNIEDGQIIQNNAAARYNDESKQIAIAGYDPWKEGLDILKTFQGWSLSSGRWPGKENQILIGQQVANKTFSKKIAAGSEMTIRGKKLEVAGILNSLGNQQDDSMAYMDMKVYQDLTGEKRGTASYALAKLKDGAEENAVASAIEKSLEKTRKRRTGTEEVDFSVITSEKIGEITGSILGIIQIVIIGFASIAIVVGGIGITNSMFTAVRERTREIGVMKAIGAKNSAILAIFLIEAGIIGILGGIGGLLLGIILAKGVDYYAQLNPSFYFRTTIALWMIIFALFFSFSVGCLAGFFPARQAAKLKPVDALRRYE